MNTFTVTIHRKDQILTKVVSKDSFTIGRSLDCDISLNETLVSRVHLVVSRRWNQIWVEDKNSSNGTFINGTKIVQSTPVNVITSDKIQLGKSEYILFIDLQTEEIQPEPALPELPLENEPVMEEPSLDATIVKPPPSMAPFQAEKILHEAKRKAAQIILEGETQAEKRVQIIYQKARDAQAQGDIFYQTRMSEAHKEADAILSDFQRQGHNLLYEARTMAQELREEVDVYVQSLKEKARNDVENMISEATLQAERLKVEAMDTARVNGQQEVDVLLKKAHEEAERTVEFSKLQVIEIQAKVKGDKETLAQLETAMKDVNEELLSTREKMIGELESARQSLEAVQNQATETTKKLSEENEQFAVVSKTHQELATTQKKLEEDYKKLQERQAHLSMDIHDLDSKKDHLFKEYEGQKIFLNEKLEKEKSQIMKSEEERLEEMRLETSKRLQKMEQDILDDVIRKKATMVKEIHSLVEREIVKLMEPKQWSLISAQVEHQIQEAVDGRVASLSQSSIASAKPVDLMRKRKSEKMRWATAGLAMGALVYFISQVAVEKVSEDKSPLRTIAAVEAKKRQDDLERRKFNPPQAEELKDSYTDSVIYTRNYPEIYLDNQFQQKLYKATANYLLKTWRIDEDRSLQVLSASNALVKELLDRKTKIHPDFIKEGLEKMHIFENQTLARMKDLLGSEVRLESYRRFERNFYKEEVQRRRMAQH